MHTDHRQRFRGPIPTERRDSGASAVEYGLIVFAIAAIIVFVIIALGAYVRGTYADTCAALSGQITPSSSASCS